MKKTILGVFTAMAIINNVSAAEQKLPDPNREGGMPLMQALNERHSVKQFGDKAIDDQTLSDLLWAAYGQPQRRPAYHSDGHEPERP